MSLKFYIGLVDQSFNSWLGLTVESPWAFIHRYSMFSVTQGIIMWNCWHSTTRYTMNRQLIKNTNNSMRRNYRGNSFADATSAVRTEKMIMYQCNIFWVTKKSLQLTESQHQYRLKWRRTCRNNLSFWLIVKYWKMFVNNHSTQKSFLLFAQVTVQRLITLYASQSYQTTSYLYYPPYRQWLYLEYESNEWCRSKNWKTYRLTIIQQHKNDTFTKILRIYEWTSIFHVFLPSKWRG